MGERSVKDAFGLTNNVKAGMHLAVTLCVLVAQRIAVSYEPCKIVLIGSSPLCAWMVAKCTMLCAIGCAVLLI